ncbi:MAG: histidine kinase [Proteobacteria bacterium]|nr:MAG: histidine kinase [Pseudomonadota bacterium]
MGVLVVTPPRKRWADGFSRMSQSSQFALAGGVVLLAAMTFGGFIISAIISRATVDSTATSSALFLDSLISPVVQELAHSDTLGPGSIARLDTILAHGPISSRFIHVDLWLPDGSLAYSTTSELIGGKFATPEGAVSAFAGNVGARYTDLSAGEHVARGWSTRFLEIYVPLREHLSGRIIAVVEVHELTSPLEEKLYRLRAQTWLVLILATLLIALALVVIVWKSGRLIAEHQSALRNRLRQIEQVSEQNRNLRDKVQRASARLAEMNERYLRHVGAELHDGPAQLVGLAALKLEQIRRATDRRKRETVLQSIENVLTEALQNMRIIARGLMLPEIEGLSLGETVRSAAEAHERRTGMKVSLDCDDYRGDLSPALRICAYRFVQEGLNNAFRHAGGNGQAVECRVEGRVLSLRVSDSGSDTRPDTRGGCGLGLAGLRERVESLGGTFGLNQTEDGTTIEMSVNLVQGDEA